MVFLTVNVFHSFIDIFDVSIYLDYALNIASGQIPYLDFGVEYPQLFFIPVLLPLVPALLAQSAELYVLLFRLNGCIFDILIACVVYLIGLKIYDKKRALTAGILYATAFSSAYFSITYYDAFPVLLLMLGIMFIVYNRGVAGYLVLILGFFAKVFPVLALPFAVFYRYQESSLKQETITILKISLPLIILLFVPFLILGCGAILRPYASATGAGFGVYAATVTTIIYNILFHIFGRGVSIEFISQIMYVFMVISLLILAIIGYLYTQHNPRRFIILVLFTLFVTMFFSRFHSPNYFMWMSPLIALLLCDSVMKVGMFYLSQIIVYIEFPLTFWIYWVNLGYVHDVLSPGWYTTLLFFIIEYSIFVAIMIMIARSDSELLTQMRQMPASLKKILQKS